MVHCFYFYSFMIKNFVHFIEVSFLGMDHFRDPATVITNIFLFGVAFGCYRRLSKISSFASEELKSGTNGWRLFFLFGSIAYLFGVPVHGFSYYIPEKIHFGIWVIMGWFQILAIVFVQLGAAGQFFPSQFKSIRPLIYVQFIVSCILVLIIRKFGVVNVDIAIGLLPIAGMNLYLYSKKKIHSWLIAGGILFAIVPAVFVVFKVMLAQWFSYNDIAHVLLIVSLLLIYTGLVRNNEQK